VRLGVVKVFRIVAKGTSGQKWDDNLRTRFDKFIELPRRSPMNIQSVGFTSLSSRACSISQSTVHEYLKRAAAAKVPWPLPEGWDHERVETALFGEHRFTEQFPERVFPDFSSLHQQLQQHPHLTLQLAGKSIG
jgi:hypothetical protein